MDKREVDRKRGKESDMEIPDMVRRLCANRAFRFGLYGGLVNVGIDADHIWHYWQTGTPGRPFHGAVLLVAGGIAVGCVAYLGGLVLGKVLGR